MVDVNAGVSAAVAASLASGGVESLGFLNDIVKQLWDYINIAGCDLVKTIVEPMFKEMLPGPLSSLHFKKLDLGKTPIRFDRVDVHNRDKDIIKLDVDVIWDGDCDIQLEANVIGTVGVKKVKICGRLSVLMTPLLERLPLVSCMQIAFVNIPKIDIDFTGLADVADWGILDKKVKEIIEDVLSNVLVLPNRIPVKIDPMNPWFETFQYPLGYLRLTVVSGSGFVAPDGWFKDVPDVFCRLRMGGLPEWKTSTINNSVSPEWNESHDVLLSDHDQIITIQAMDDDLASDDKLGTGHITVGELLMAGSKAHVPLLIKNQDTGAKIEVSAEILEFVEDVSSLQANENEAEGLKSGLLVILIAGAEHLPVLKEEAASSIKVSYDKKEFTTGIVTDVPGVDCLNPPFDAGFRVELTPSMVESDHDIVITLMNGRAKLGSVNIKTSDIIGAPGATLEEKHALGNGAVINTKCIIRGIRQQLA